MASFWDGYNQKGGGTTTAPPAPTDGKGFWASYKPTPVAAPKTVDPNTLGDTKALTGALNAKQITPQQFSDRYNTLNNKPVAAPYSAKNTFSALGGALNKVFVQPVKAAAVDTTQQVIKTGKQLVAPASTQAQRQAITTNQAGAAKSNEYQQAIKGLNLNNSAQGTIQAQRMAAQGAKAPEIKAFLLQDAAKLNAQTQKGINAASVISGVNVGDNIAAKAIVSAKQAFIDGPKELMARTPITALSSKSFDAPTGITKVPVEGGDVSPTGVPVRTPVHAGIKDISSTTKIGVRTPNQMSDKAFTDEFNKLSKGYDKSTKSTASLSPAQAKALSQTIETHYQTKLNDLLDRYHNPDLSAPTKPKTLASAVTNAKNYGGNIPVPRARSAFDRLEKQTAEAQAAPTAVKTTKVAQTTASAPKAVSTAPEEPTVPRTPAGTEKVSGSSLRTQQEAVQAGMKSEATTTGATFNTVSHTEEAAKAVKLVNEDPQKAMDIAMGKSRGDNVSHESAVYHAVKNAEIEKAKKTGDWGTVADLANSQRHTGVSEAAQKLGAEGYNVNPHDPVNIMNDLAKTRQSTIERSAKTTVSKEATSIAKEVKASAPKVSRQDWHSFIQELRCK